MKILMTLFFILSSTNIFARNAIDKKRYELLSGVRGNNESKHFWDKKYSDTNYVYGKVPAKFLAKNYHYIKNGSNVLDMGMGEGRNAVFLARKGFNVTGIDISTVAVKKARLLAREFGVRINTVTASMNNHKIKKESFDAIICFYYVDRSLHKKMLSWLKPGGILIYETHTYNQLKVKGHEKTNKRFLIRPTELLTMFKGYKILKYEEPLHLDEFTASIILQKK